MTCIISQSLLRLLGVDLGKNQQSGLKRFCLRIQIVIKSLEIGHQNRHNRKIEITTIEVLLLRLWFFFIFVLFMLRRRGNRFWEFAISVFKSQLYYKILCSTGSVYLPLFKSYSVQELAENYRHFCRFLTWLIHFKLNYCPIVCINQLCSFDRVE